jgi:hypothetical protein
MVFGVSRKPPESLRIGWMAAALVAAAFLGASLGLVWQSSGFGDADDKDQAETDGRGDGEAQAETPPATPSPAAD